MSRSLRSTVGVVVAIGVVAASCSGSLGSTFGGPAPVVSSSFVLAPSITSSVPHSGVRRISSHRVVASKSYDVEYRESVAQTRSGDFDVECTEVITTSMSSRPQFELLHEAREGFIHRYRDFHVFDPALAGSNWEKTTTGNTKVVAGRACSETHVERRLKSHSTLRHVEWDLYVDDQTGLVLEWKRYADGVLSDEGVYESIVYGEPTNYVAHVPSTNETELDPSIDPQRAFTYEVAIPKVLPDGFVVKEMSKIVDRNTNDEYLKVVYTDGIEVCFFLFASDGTPLHSRPTTTGKGGTPVPPSGSTTTSGRDEIVYVMFGDIVVAQYDDGSHLMVVAGRLSLFDIQSMIESAMK
ncbi:MAG: hypothetical protein R3F34_17065 [Planctomycetota bacterium]